MALFKEKMRCPVCKALLGERFKDEVFFGHCDECKASFFWEYKQKVPRATLDKCKQKKCGCGLGH
jgi:hypothetical protein